MLLSLYNTYHSKYSSAIYVNFLLKLSSEPNESRQSCGFRRTDFFLWIGQKNCAAASFGLSMTVNLKNQNNKMHVNKLSVDLNYHLKPVSWPITLEKTLPEA